MSTLVSSKLKIILASPEGRSELFKFLSNKGMREKEINVKKDKSSERYKVKKMSNE